MSASSKVAVLCSLLTFVHAAGNTANIAVVGAGPHGLIAALELTQLGHGVTVFEKETIELPIIQSLELNSVVYEYLGQALLPAANSHGSGPPAALLNFAEKYGQPLEPLPAAITTLSFDSVAGVNPVPSSWLPFLTDAADQLELLQELAAGYAVLLELESFQPNPSGVVDSGVAFSNQTFADWAQEISLPAFTDLIELVFNSALSGPVADTIAANILSPSRLYIPGGLRQAFLLQGINSTSAQAQAANLSSLLQGDPTPAAFYHLPNGVRALFQAAVQSEDIDIQLGTPVTSVANDGTVTYEGGQQKFDIVIVSERPAAAAAMLAPPLAAVYEGAHTGLIDLWIFNATSLPNATSLANHLQTPFLGFVTDASGITPANGTPAYIIRLDYQAPIVCVGSYVTANVTQAASTALATSTLQHYGLNVSSTVQYSRVQFSSSLADSPQLDHYGNVYLLGEAFSGIGIVTAIEYVSSKISEWFDVISPGLA